MLKDIEIEKYKMLISTIPEDKAKEAMEMLEKAISCVDASKVLPKVNKFVMQNADVYIVKDQDEIKDKDLTGYGAVMFDCDVVGVPDFSNCPKKMIFNEEVDVRFIDVEKLPDFSESIVMGSFDCRECVKLNSLENSPRAVGEDFYCYHEIKTDGHSPKIGGLLYKERDAQGWGVDYYEDICVCKNGKIYSVFNLPKDEEFVINSDLYLDRATKMENVFLPDLSNVIVKGDFVCHNLKSLKGSPKEVEGDYICTDSDIVNLAGISKKIGGDFDCSYCEKLMSFRGAQDVQIEGNLKCIECFALKDVVGLPKYIGGEIKCDEAFCQVINKEVEKNKKLNKKLIIKPKINESR